jgi:hypothetical protein
MRQTITTLFAFALLIVGCKTGGQYVPDPLPPIYDQHCTPSHTTYEDLAWDTTDFTAPGEIPTDPTEAFKKIEGMIKAKGINIVPKAVTGVDQFDKFTTTLPRNIYVSPDYLSRSDRDKAILLWHEWVHVKQWQRLGVQEFARRWLASAEGRFSLETPAYRESFRLYRLFNVFKSEEALRKYAHKRAEAFYNGYALAGMPKPCMLALAVEIWSYDGS